MSVTVWTVKVGGDGFGKSRGGGSDCAGPPRPACERRRRRAAPSHAGPRRRGHRRQFGGALTSKRRARRRPLSWSMSQRLACVQVCAAIPPHVAQNREHSGLLQRTCKMAAAFLVNLGGTHDSGADHRKLCRRQFAVPHVRHTLERCRIAIYWKATSVKLRSLRECSRSRSCALTRLSALSPIWRC